MPPRSVTAAILAFWLATNGWLIYHDLGPRLKGSEPALFEMDLTDEARIPLNSDRAFTGNIRWTLEKNGEKVGRSETEIHYHSPENPYELGGRLKLPPPGQPYSEELWLDIPSSFSVDWNGHCHRFTAKILPNRSVPELVALPQVYLEGTLRQRQCTVRWTSPALDGSSQREPETVPLSDRGNVLNLLHPLNRMAGLSQGQRWQMPVFDPLAALSGGRTPTLRRVEAQVEEGTLERQHRPVACWIVTYHSNGVLQGRTWVRVFDALVLQQEMYVVVDIGIFKAGDRLVLSRDMDY